MALTIAPETVPLTVDDGSTVRVGGTRVTLDTVVSVFRQGHSAEEIVRRYPVLAVADVYSVIGYYLRHTAEVDAYLGERQREAEEIRRQIGEQADPPRLREKLKAYRAEHRDGSNAAA